MTNREQFYSACHELTEFCLARAGKCFGGWPREKIFLRIAGAALAGNLFFVKEGGKVNALAIAKPTDKGLFVWEVIGTRARCQELFQRALLRWPTVTRFFAYRGNKVVELNPQALRRFCRG